MKRQIPLTDKDNYEYMRDSRRIHDSIRGLRMMEKCRSR